MTDDHFFNNISLGGRGGTNPGHVKISSEGILWKKQGGGKVVQVDKSDIAGVSWMKVPRTNELGVRSKDGLYYKFTGFRDQDVAALTPFIQTNCGISPEEKQLSVSGHNSAEADLDGNMLSFMVGQKQAFEVSLADVSQTQLQGKNDVMEFHVDDTTGANEVFHDKVMSMADVDAGREEAVVTFEGIAILTPRGRYSVELHLSFLRLQGQANDFKIQYSSVVRLFLLPKSNQPHTFVVVTLDPPVRKGQTLYPHIVLQFETDYGVQSELSMSEDLLNTKYRDKLEPSYKGLIHEVFTTILRGLSGAKVTKPGIFRSAQDGYAVKSSLKAEYGFLYPLEKSFFFLPKPPTLILHEEIDYVEFERHAAGGSNMHYFDLLIRLKTEQEHLFRNIRRNEYHNLFEFISGKGLKIMNLGDMQTADGVAAVLQDEDNDAVDPHLERIKNEAGGDESDAEVFCDKIMSMADVGAGGEGAVVTFEGIAILTPRGRYSVELHLSFLRLQGQANDFKIQYSSVVRLFLLPKSNQPHTFVVVTLDPPIRKGQTLYPHIVLQFETDYVVQRELSISKDLLNTKYGDKLGPSYKGLIHEVFTTILRGLSGAKVTKPGKFCGAQDGYAVKSSLKAEDGVLYPLEKSFFFLPKPPTLILHEEIDYVKFERHATGGSNMHCFVLLIKLKTEQEHLFRNIQRNEYHNLFGFISGKGLKIMNLGDMQIADGVADVLQDEDDDAVDPHLERIKSEAGGDEGDEEDGDFVVDKDDGGSPTDDSGEDDSDAGGSEEEKEKPSKKDSKKESSSMKASTSKKKSKDAEEDTKKKKQKKEEDPNAPKRAMSGFMFFSEMERENIKRSNPGISFTDIGGVLGEKWKRMSAEEKEPYEAKARADKKRYKDEISGYKNPKPMNIDSGNESDSA